jgi:exopolysaccharide production protein ExoZ
VVFAMFLVLGFMHMGPLRIPHDAPHALLTIVENLLFLPGIFDMPAIISAAWSLSYEWFFYLVLPFVVIGLRLRHWNRISRLTLMAAICVIFEGLCLLAPSIFPTFSSFEGSHIRLTMFVCGMIVYELLESPGFRAFFVPRIETIAIVIAAVTGVAFLAFVAAVVKPAPTTDSWSATNAAHQVIATFIGFGALGLVVLRNDGKLARFFTATWLRWTGNISYSFYLMHSIPMHFAGIVLTRLSLHVNPTLVYIVAFPFVLATTWAVSAALFVCVEKPLSLRPRRAAVVRSDLQVA